MKQHQKVKQNHNSKKEEKKKRKERWKRPWLLRVVTKQGWGLGSGQGLCSEPTGLEKTLGAVGGGA